MDFKFTIAVAADGALGSVARYLVGVGGKAVRIGIYVGTLIINVTGFISDWCIRRTVRHQMGPVAGNAHVPDSRPLWRPHDLFHVLS
jgi:hypothetical protein